MKTIAFRTGITAFAIASVSFFASCHQTGNEASEADSSTPLSEAASVKEQLSVIHEETMGKIAPLRRVEDSLRKRIQVFTMEKKDTSALSQAANALNSCDTAMFGWMGRYHDQTMSADSANVTSIKQHLASLKQLDAATDSAIKQGRALLQ